MARPKRDHRVGYAPPLIDAEILARVDAWRQAQPQPLTQKAAFEQLLDRGLKAKKGGSKTVNRPG
jgi:hypothetical protein